MKQAKLILVCVSWLLVTVMSSHSVIAEELTTEDFIRFTANKSMNAVAAAKYALDNSSSADVKVYAQRILEEQSAVLDSLQALAHVEGVVVGEKNQRGAYVFIRKGETFETAYANKRTVELKRMVRVVRKALFSENANVRRYAEQTLPVLMQHWYQSQRLTLALQNPSVPAESMVASR